MSSFLVFFCCLFFYVLECIAQQDGLLMVQIVYRHGDRSPTNTFPTNPLPESAWPQGFGQLTQRGMRQHFKLGEYFRKRYIDGVPYRLLNGSYDRHEVRLRSTDYDRTLMSAYSNLAGLYPPSGEQIWNKDFPWQPIPVHTIPQIEDYLLDTDVKCPKYDDFYIAALNSDDIKAEEKNNKEFYAFVANKTGNKNENITKTWKVYDPIFCARQHGLQEPDWVNVTWKGVTIYDKLAEINSLQFDVQYNRAGESRLRGGPLLDVMIKNMKLRMSNTLPYKTHIYSAHDSTMAAILSAMKVFNKIAPPYASSLMVELHRKSGKDVVLLLYKNESNTDPYPMQVPGCAAECPFEDFVRITKDNVPVDWHQECQGTKSMPRADGLILLFIGIVLATALIFTVLVYSILRRIGRRRGYEAYDSLNEKNAEGS